MSGYRSRTVSMETLTDMKTGELTFAQKNKSYSNGKRVKVSFINLAFPFINSSFPLHILFVTSAHIFFCVYFL